MTILENTQVVDFLRSATVRAWALPQALIGSAWPLSVSTERSIRPIFLTELGRGGFKLVEVGGIVLVCDVALPDESAAA